MTARRDLFVASAGGHLTQLLLIAEALDERRPRTFVTYDHPQAHSLLAEEWVVHGFGPSSRSVLKAAGNWRLARRLLGSGMYARVVSTGSAIAVPFLLEAARRGIEAHYVESATRTRAPSLSGRILERLSGSVRLHTQHARWAGGRWELVPSVFAGFSVEHGAPPTGPLRVVVSLGTHRFPFDRMLRAVAGVLRPGDSVLVQHGATAPVTMPCDAEHVPSMPARRLESEIAAADVVLAHAGTGIALTSMAAGKQPVLLAREVAHDEHVDDHQHDTARELAERGLAIHAVPEKLDRAMLARAAAATVVRDGTRRVVAL